MNKPMIRAIFSLILFLGCFTVANAATWYVDASSADDSGAATNWATAKQTIQAAVDLAVDGDVVLVTNGVYDSGGAVTPGYALTNRVCVTNTVELRSVNGPEHTIISGAPGSNGSNDVDSIRGVYLSGGAKLTGFTVTNGSTMTTGDYAYDQFGGGILLTDTCVVDRCVIAGNTAYAHAGGVSLQLGGTINNCLIAGNTVEYHSSGGLLINGPGGTVNNCTLIGNSAPNYGGGASMWNGGTMNNCIVWSNRAGISNNDLYRTLSGLPVRYTCASDGLTDEVDGCITNNPLFSDATAGNYRLQATSPCIQAGSIDYVPSDSQYDLAGNPRTAEGTVDMGAYEGGVYMHLGGEMNNCTVVDNSASGSGGGAFISQGAAIHNNILWQNTAVADGNDLFRVGFGLEVYYTCASDGVGQGVDGCTTSDPQFADAAHGDYQLTISSPCFNTAGNVYAPTNLTPCDLRGEPRIWYNTVDMGAYEIKCDLYVDASRPDDTGDGLTWATAKRTIQAAVDLAPYTIWVTNGVYNEGSTVTPGYTMANRVFVTNDIAIRSVNGVENTVIKGGISIRGAFLSGGASLIGFTVEGGYTRSAGDTIYDKSGGGLWMTDGCEIWNCVVNSNYASVYGGCVYLHGGGALYNTVMQHGGAAYGGGVCMNAGGSSYNCDLLNNSVSQYGGGAALLSGGTVYNSIVWGNSGSAGWNDIYQDSALSTVGYTCASDGITNGVDGCTTSNPLFDELSADYRLSQETPCFNSGDNTYAPPTNVVAGDLYGNDRIIFGTVDMGVCERRYMISSNRSPAVGGTVITLTNGVLGSGADITNVTVCGMEAVIVTQGVNWVQFETAASTNPYVNIIGNIVIQSGSLGETVFENALTYERIPGAVTFYVDAARPDDSGDGGTWATAKKTIQAAVDLALTGDLVLVTNGVYDTGGAGTPGAELQTNRVVLSRDITLQSVNGPEVTIIDGAYTNRGVFMAAGLMSGFTVTHGYVGMEEGGVYRRGGGIWMSTNCVVSNCVVTGNTGYYVLGGGLYLASTGTVINCRISSNTAYQGGGIETIGSAHLIDTVISDNEAEGHGGGAYLTGSGTPLIQNCRITGNRVKDYGGGIYAERPITMVNTLISGNTAAQYGGLYVGNGGALGNCTVYGNSAPGAGGVSFGGYTYVYNCVVWSNMDDSGVSDLGADASLYAYLYNTCATGGGITNGINGCTTNDPLFADADAGNYRLLPDSPCLNSGDNAHAPTNRSPCDLTGNPRIIWDTVDMGAFETAFFLVPDRGISTGGDTVTLTNFTALGDGTDITNVTLCGVSATIEDQGSNWIHVTAGPSTNLYRNILGDLVVQSTSLGPCVFSNAFTYTRITHTLYVDASRSDDSGNGESWGTAKRTLQAAVDIALDGDAICITNGVYNEGGTAGSDTQTNRVYVTNSVTIYSVNGPEHTVIEGAPGSDYDHSAQSVRGVYLSDGAKLTGFTISNGYTMAMGPYGAGVWLSDSCVVERCVINGNKSSRYGGGICFSAGGTLNNCLITHNEAVDNSGGGAILLDPGGTLNNCTLYGNSATELGGGVIFWNGGTMNNCIAWSNSAGTSGDNLHVFNVGTIRSSCSTEGITNGVNNCTTNDPQFVSMPDMEYYLQPSSPCVNGGDNPYAPTNGSPYDLAGRDRIINTTVDMGCYEMPTNVYLSVAVSGPGQLTGDLSGWYAVGNSISITSVPYAYCTLSNWTGDISGAAPDSNPLNLQMDQYRSVTAHFVAAVTTNTATPLWWLAQFGWSDDFESIATNDADGDDFLTWEEYVTDTDPTNSASCFHIDVISNTVPVSVWFDSSSNRSYSLLGCTDLLSGIWTNVPGTDSRMGSGGFDMMQDTNDVPYKCYRVGVEVP